MIYCQNKGYAKKYSKTVPLDVQVAHYTPSIFPLVPVINETINQLCTDSWKKIVSKKELQRDDQGNSNGQVMAGITLFYNDFYSRLAEVDKNAKIEAVLSAHSSGGMNKIAEKGAIIIRIVNYVLSLKQNDAQTQQRLYILGKAHAKRKIRPYMYSVFVQCLLYTLSGNQSIRTLTHPDPAPHPDPDPPNPKPTFDCLFTAQLGLEATHEVMEAWVNMFAFIMKTMLPLAIVGQTIETEIAINAEEIKEHKK